MCTHVQEQRLWAPQYKHNSLRVFCSWEMCMCAIELFESDLSAISFALRFAFLSLDAFHRQIVKLNQSIVVGGFACINNRQLKWIVFPFRYQTSIDWLINKPTVNTSRDAANSMGNGTFYILFTSFGCEQNGKRWRSKRERKKKEKYYYCKLNRNVSGIHKISIENGMPMAKKLHDK